MASVCSPERRAEVQAVLGWLLATDSKQNAFAMARRLGVMYLIWNNRIWSTSRADEGLRPYSDCAGHPERSADSRCHRDHLHISLSWEGARGVTSYWTGRVAPADSRPVPGGRTELGRALLRVQSAALHPLPGGHRAGRRLTDPAHPDHLLRPGTAGRDDRGGGEVAAEGGRVTATGTFGPATKRALQRWQGDHGLTRTGIVGRVTWRVLLSSRPREASRLESAA